MLRSCPLPRRRFLEYSASTRPDPVLLRLGGVAGDVEDLELDAVRVVEEDGVVAGCVGVLLRPALDLGAPVVEPVGALVDGLPRRRLEGEVVKPDAVAVVRLPAGVCASRSPIELPGPERYQIVSPRSPSTSPTRCQPSGSSSSR